MKKILLTIGLLVASSSVFAANFCAAGICYFGSLDKATKHVEFHCTPRSNSTKVSFSTHNVHVAGFVNDEKITLNGGYRVKRLKSYYFKITPDLNHLSSSTKTITYKSNGDMECRMGKGGRKLLFNWLATL